MSTLNAYRAQMRHRHTWETWVLDGLGEVDVCDCGATRRIEIPDPRMSTETSPGEAFGFDEP